MRNTLSTWVGGLTAIHWEQESMLRGPLKGTSIKTIHSFDNAFYDKNECIIAVSDILTL